MGEEQQNSAQDFEQAVERYVAYFESLRSRDLVLLGKYFTKDARFTDPFNDVTGHQEIRIVFEDMFERTENPRFKIVHSALCKDGHTALLRWDLLFAVKGRKQSISGMSEVSFNKDGLVVAHIDYWDPTGPIYRKVPILKQIMSFVRKKLSAQPK